MAYIEMNLQLFGDGGAAGASAAPAAGSAGDSGEAAAVAPGTLDDGTVVDNRLAARMEEQARKRRNRGEAPVKAPAQQAQPAEPAAPESAAQPEEPAEPSLEEQWNEAKKGKFKEFIGRDIAGAIQDRFKNQADANEKLNGLQPMLDALMKKTGAQSVEELQKLVLDDDSLYEDEAEEMGMPVEAYKNYKKLQDEHNALLQKEAQEQEQMMLRQHFQNLARQAEELRKVVPDFDLRKEMENETFRRLVAPNSGLNVESAFYAVHHAELGMQAMQYGFQRAQDQISQTLQSNRARPVEGAIQGGQPADVAIDPRSMTREERQRLLERARRGEKIVF